jgi:hypothetical protein
MYYIKQVNDVKLVSEREALPLILEWLTRPGFTTVKAEDTIIVGGTRRVCDILRLNLKSLPLLGVFNDSPSQAERVMRRGGAEDGAEGDESRRGKVILYRRSGRM